MTKPRRILLIIALNCLWTASAGAQRLRVAVLDFGGTEAGQRAAEEVTRALSAGGLFLIADREESRVAARGLGYNGSLNLTLQEARDLGGAIGCDFYLTGDAQTIRRSRSSAEFYMEAYASVFVVSARTGRLILWDRPNFEAKTPDEAEKALRADLKRRAVLYGNAILEAREAERRERTQMLERISAYAPTDPVIEDAPDDEAAAEREGLSLPRPYRRLRPAYPDTAARAEAEATVDVSLEIDAEGEVLRAEVVRWGGFGLDDAALSTARQLHFAPARRGGVPVPVRVLLRYNFRRPPK